MSMIKDASYITGMMFLYLTSLKDAKCKTFDSIKGSVLAKRNLSPMYESSDGLLVKILNDVLKQETELR